MKTSIRNSNRNRAFTLIEMVLVLAIVALLVGAGIVNLTGVLDRGKEKRVKMDVNTLTSALRTYEMDAGFVPTTAQGLDALVHEPSTAPKPKRWKPSMKKNIQDPWSRDYQYRQPGTKNPESFDIWSFGPDGIESADDIGNWDD